MKHKLTPATDFVPETLAPVIQALTRAGEHELATKLAAYGAARAKGADVGDLVELWLDAKA